ncbi:MAG: hypothetical protein B6244_08665 [Candidatus Cloacimonetes bacterium 4572_55]|nr:MAG: hypothetical protein B6244_08665 [Candidatus Cloacimonetes bacterium 4572_55]
MGENTKAPVQNVAEITTKPTPSPLTPQLTKDNAFRLIRENLRKGKMPDTVKMIMASGKMPNGDEVPVDIILRLSRDPSRGVRLKAHQLISEFGEDVFYEILWGPYDDPELMDIIINRFSKHEEKIRAIFFDPGINMGAKQTCLEKFPHIFAHFLARSIIRIVGGQILFSYLKARPEDKRFVLDTLLEAEVFEDDGEHQRSESTDVQKALIKNFSPNRIRRETKLIFAQGKTPSGDPLPIEIISKLLVDADKEVRSQAAMTLMDFDSKEMIHVLRSEHIDSQILQALAHYIHDPKIVEAICVSPHVTDKIIVYMLENNFKVTISAIFRHLTKNPQFTIFKDVLQEYPEHANFILSLFYEQYDENLDLSEWIRKARLEKQVNMLAKELEPIIEMEQHTYTMAEILLRLSPENIALIGDIIHGKASGGQRNYDRLFLSLLEIELLREIWGDETFGKVMGYLKRIKSTALLKTWALMLPYKELSGTLALLVHTFWKLGKQFCRIKGKAPIYITVTEIFDFIWNLLKAVQQLRPTFSFFDLKTLFLGSRSMRYTADEEVFATECLLVSGFRCQANGNFMFDLGQFLTVGELKTFGSSKEATKKRKFTQEEIQKVKQELKKLSAKQKISLIPQAPVDVVRILVRDPDPNVVAATLRSKLATQREAMVLALQKTTASNILEEIAKNKNWVSKYPIKIALVNNPKTPLDISLGLIVDLLQQDLMRLIQSSEVAPSVRAKAEQQFRNRISELSIEEREKMAERASIELVDVFLDDQNETVLLALLRSAGIRESHIMKLAKRKFTTGAVLEDIASNPVWINNYSILLEVVNHQNLPQSAALKLMRTLSPYDLRQLSRNRDISSSVQEGALRMYLQKGGR